MELTFDEVTPPGNTIIELQLNGKRALSSDEEESVSSQKRNKKLFDDTADLGLGAIEIEPDASKQQNIRQHDDTQVLSPDYEDINSTFAMSTVEKKKKSDLISSILSEQNVSASNRLQIKNGMKKNSFIYNCC